MITDFLGLSLTEASETSKKFLDWRQSIDGYNVNSNMELIDAAIKDIDAVISELNAVVGGKANGLTLDPATGILQLTSDGVAIEGASVTIDLAKYYTAEQVDEIVSTIQSAIALKADGFTLDADTGVLQLTSNGTPLDGASVTINLKKYYTKDETYNKTEIDNLVSNVSVDLTGYATEAFVNQKDEDLSKAITVNAEDIASLSTVVGEMQEDMVSGDVFTYDVAYNDPEDPDVGENVFVFYEISNEGTAEETKKAKRKFTITGGSGGGGGSLKIGYITPSPVVVTADNINVILGYNFSGTDSSGDAVSEGEATWSIGGAVIRNKAYSGENYFDVSQYLSIGTQKVGLSITDESGNLATKSWSVQVVDVRITSAFDDTATYTDNVLFQYTPFGAISKDVHFVLYDENGEGTEIGKVTTSSSGVPATPFEIPKQAHGSHLLETYITAMVGNTTITSNRIFKDIMWRDTGNTQPLIGCAYQKFTARQYDTTNIAYTVDDPSTTTPTVQIAVDGVVVSEPTLTTRQDIFSYKSGVVGEHVITITCGATVKTLVATITELGIDITPITTGLAFDFDPAGKSNNDVDRVWTDGTVSMRVSDNFDWVNGGYQLDENGDQYFCIKAGTMAAFNYKLFEDEAKRNGKEFKLVFKTTNVAKPDTTFLNCVDNTTDSDHIGIRMDVHEAFIFSQAGKLHLPYSEGDIIEFEFNISNNSTADGNIPMVMGYEDGVSTCPLTYDNAHNFTQNSPKDIVFGSNDCDLHIYRLKVYNRSLTDSEILTNFIADARNAEEMISRYERNQIYDENQELNPDILAERCPWLRIIKIEAPRFTKNKSDKVPNTTIQYIYKDGDAILDNWTAYNCQHSGQGTSSNNYGAAGRNLDLIMNKSGIDGVKPYIILGDKKTEVSKVSLTRDSIEVNYFNVKVNIASSENANNALLQRRYNTYNPYKRTFIRENADEIRKIKDTMEFYNCVIFIRETDEDVSTHQEFADNNWHFYAIGNIGDSKKTDETRLTDPSDPYECIIEIMDVEKPLSDFPVDTMMNAMGYTIDETTKETIYTWAVDKNLGILYEKIDGEYVLTSDTTVDLTKTYYVDILEHDDFSEDYTYGWRYLSDEDNPDIAAYCHQKWIEAYRFITTSTDEEFYARLGDYFVLDSVLYYYLFTTRYTMVDNRAKNSFWHYGKTGEVDADGNPIRKWDLAFDYDNDTALGINNYGAMVYRYGYEDTDVDEDGIEIFRESDSTFFCRMRDRFHNELKSLYQSLNSQRAWDSENLIAQFDNWQSQFPEELWRVDIQRKYIRTYNSSFINGEGDAQFLVNMAHGKKKYQRRQYEREQDKYMASKYQTDDASSDDNSIIIRCPSISDDVAASLAVTPNYSMKLTPYSYMYLNVEYSNGVSTVRAEPNIEVEVPFTGRATDIIKIYSASGIQSLGDISPCYPATVSTSNASKLKELIIGNETEGYDNPYFTTLTTGANPLLEKLNVENVSGLTQTLELSRLGNLRELYAYGSNATGVIFADGGKIQIAELPAVGTIVLKNLLYLTSLDIVDLSKLTQITVEHCDTIDLVELLNNAPNLNRVRLLGVDWELDDSSLLERLYNLKGLDQDDFQTDRAVLTGAVHVNTIKQYDEYNYKAAWPDLDITYDTRINQYIVTFKNDDGTVLNTQYVDANQSAIPPEDPTKPSTAQYDFTFAGWDTSYAQIRKDTIITATYEEHIRSYTVRWLNGNEVLWSVTKEYGTSTKYECEDGTGIGGVPIDTSLESNAIYRLFNGWSHSTGFIDCDIDVHAKFSEEIVPNDKTLADMNPTELYSLVKAGILSPTGANNNLIISGDTIDVVMGQDYDFENVDSQEFVSVGSPMVFDGTSYYDTGIKLFDEDKSFVLAIDFEYADTTSSAMLASCYERTGFALKYDTTPVLKWGSSAYTNVSDGLTRELVVVRKKLGDTNLYVYSSNRTALEINEIVLVNSLTTQHNATLTFGANLQSDGYVNDYAKGTIHWAKLWTSDLGEDTCRKLASWTRDTITWQAAGSSESAFRTFGRVSKGNVDDGRPVNCCLLMKNLLDVHLRMDPVNTNEGGWAEAELHDWVNTRMLNAWPEQWKLLFLPVYVSSSIGMNSTDIVTTEDIMWIPSCKEMGLLMTTVPYSNESEVPFCLIDTIKYLDNGDGEAFQYWLRSPYYDVSSDIGKKYFHVITSGGSTTIGNTTGGNLNPSSVCCGVCF